MNLSDIPFSIHKRLLRCLAPLQLQVFWAGFPQGLQVCLGGYLTIYDDGEVTARVLCSNSSRRGSVGLRSGLSVGSKCTFFLCSFWRSLKASIFFTSSFRVSDSWMWKCPMFSSSAGQSSKMNHAGLGRNNHRVCCKLWFTYALSIDRTMLSKC